MVTASDFYGVLKRKKKINSSDSAHLLKCFTTFDLTTMGIGSTLGVGVYVLAGEVSKKYAGPAVVISFAIAAVVSIFAGLCYAEFGARVPKAGSAYIYSYVSVGAASVVKGLSTYVDALANNSISTYFLKTVPIHTPGFNDYADFFAFGVILVFTVGLAFGVKESAIVNNVFTIVNVCVVVCVIAGGLWWVDFNNWKIPESQVPEGYGKGGFAPYGAAGILRGAAICFYGFIGFDVIATAGEEAKNPKRSIPIAIVVSLTVIFFAYFGISSVLTMMLPYYEQNENSPLPYAFKRFGWHMAEYFITVGAIFGLLASLMGSMFPLPRIIYAMASDGLLYRVMGRVNKRFSTPMYGTFISGLATGILATFFNLSQLVAMMSIGTLLAYSMVAVCVLILRYEVNPHDDMETLEPITNPSLILKKTFASSNQKPDNISSQIATMATVIFCGASVAFGLILKFMIENLMNGETTAIVLLSLTVLVVVVSAVTISCQPKSTVQLPFQVPLAPWIPCLSILTNMYLMMELDLATWIRFAVWIAMGLVIYFTYSIKNSNEKYRQISQKSGESETSSLHNGNGHILSSS